MERAGLTLRRNMSQTNSKLKNVLLVVMLWVAGVFTGLSMLLVIQSVWYLWNWAFIGIDVLVCLGWGSMIVKRMKPWNERD